MIKALIFDLDNCLAAANEVEEHLFEPAFEAIRAVWDIEHRYAGAYEVKSIYTIDQSFGAANSRRSPFSL